MSSLYKRMVRHTQEHLRQRSCDRKVPYQTEGDAWAAINRLLMDEDINPEDSKHAPYKCSYCRYWHFTHKARGEK